MSEQDNTYKNKSLKLLQQIGLTQGELTNLQLRQISNTGNLSFTIDLTSSKAKQII